MHEKQQLEHWGRLATKEYGSKQIEPRISKMPRTVVHSLPFSPALSPPTPGRAPPQVLGVLLCGLSLIIIWSEGTIFTGVHPDLSPFSLAIR